MRAIPLAAALWATSVFAQTLPPSATQPPPPSSTSITNTPVIPPSDVPATPPSDLAPLPGAGEEKPLSWGVLIDVGFPDGVGASAVFRPMTWLRLSAGGTFNVISGGVRAGVTLAPFYFAVTPSLSAEVGHYFSGNVGPFLSAALPNVIPANTPVLVAYDYVNGHVGVEFGPPRNFIFFFRVGMSYVQTSFPGFEALVQQAIGSATGGPPDPTITAQNPIIRFTAPSLKLGFLLYF